MSGDLQLNNEGESWVENRGPINPGGGGVMFVDK